MKHKKIILYGAIVLLMMMGVYGSQPCITPVDNTVLGNGNNSVLCTGNYNLIDAASNGIIVISGSNVRLDCNGSTIRGNRATNSKGIVSFGKVNVTVINCKIKDYYWGIQMTGANRIRIQNNTFSNNSNRDLSLSLNHSIISGNSFNDSVTAFYLSAAWYNNISGNSFLHDDYNIWIDNKAKYNRFYNNNFTHCEFSPCIDIRTQSNYNQIYDNRFTTIDRAIRILNTNHTKIEKNNITNTTKNIDRYNTGIVLGDNTSYTMIRNNRFVEIGCIGILTLNVGLESNNTISGNYFNHVSNADMIANSYTCENEPQVAIHLALLDRTWNTNNPRLLVNQGNFTIIGNTFGANTQLYLRNQGAKEVTHDLTGYWQRNLSTIGNISVSSFYISNSYTELYNTNNSHVKNYILGEGFSDKVKTNYWISNTRIKIRNKDTVAHTFNYNTTSRTQMINGSTVPTENIGSFFETLGASERAIIIALPSTTAPKFTSVATTITDLTYSYTKNEWLDISCEGTGAIVLDQLNELGTTKDIYHNGIYVETIDGNTYTISTCSDWRIKTGTTRISGMTATILRTGVMVIIGVVLFSAIALPIVTGSSALSIGYFITAILITIIASIILVFIQNIT